ncbi:MULTISPECIES: hypothetical protein [Enterobacter]|uniref:hypothetical protein n=1 Tax=Enterobacter TaxID=547 RepID=UPI001BDFFC0F|nr:hypothetical protein [Enterobacter hormaechei]MBT1945835.1 hypothetical protein [Enterobacter hormaechei subsp. xiangfangensis]HBI6864316.1 hypothetical protein [Enterobacter pasteurii]HDR2709944.1 hypothetical protein [Enterobacter mori]MCU6154329.1 hypothetical protein [Enterobacter hormaechei]HAV1851724.1 hypothetical protein [Enterobacter hormaechei subsp. xiangfangensis]
MKQSNKGSKWWVALSVSFYFAAAPVPGGEAKLNFNGAHFFNVNVTQVTNNITVTNIPPVHSSITPPKPKPKVNKATHKSSCVR